MADEDDFDDGDDDDDFCDHDYRDVDILEGRWRCYRCGDAGWLSNEQLRREIRLAAEVYECIAEEADATPLPPQGGDAT